jgi:hypothetical protein
MFLAGVNVPDDCALRARSVVIARLRGTCRGARPAAAGRRVAARAPCVQEKSARSAKSGPSIQNPRAETN